MTHIALNPADYAAHILEWYLDAGVDICLQDMPENRLRDILAEREAEKQDAKAPSEETALVKPVRGENTVQPSLLGTSETRKAAIDLASKANSLEALKQTIQDFDGIELKQTATHMVFSDGNPDADIMLVGEAPGADEDRIGKPFVGVSGQLLDRILKYASLFRESEETHNSIYISNILNWRPPGNRTPTQGEIETSLPFIEKHILLAKPKLLVFCGGVSAKSLLHRNEGISKLRGKWHDWTPSIPALADPAFKPIPAIATYHPSYLLRTPIQKKLVWQDMIGLMKKMESL